MKWKLITTGVLAAALLLFFSKDIGHLFASEAGRDGSNNALHVKQDQNKKRDVAADVTIVQQWNLPDELREVSGIAWIAANRFACVQDEDGFIFIYNTANATVEKKIPFAGPGDYEGITLAGNTAYVVRSDGRLYEVANYNSAQPKVTEYKTPLSADHNIEGLTFDRNNNRLLLAPKDKDPSGNKDGKGVYAFDLATKGLAAKPVLVIPNGGAKKGKGIRPAALGIHPKTGHYYVVDGPKSRLVIVDGSGKLVADQDLGSRFAQPEGITFDPSGRVFISNERGKGSPANIMEVAIGKN